MIREEEDLLWSPSLLGDDNSQYLLDTMLDLFVIYFALRADKEHKQLCY